MSLVFNMVGGTSGGGGSAFAYIVATYPAGATCTATNGTTTLSALGTSGAWMFSVPSAGTWTITATQGVSTQSAAVSITTQDQVESVGITFRKYIVEAGTAVETLVKTAGTITEAAGILTWASSSVSLLKCTFDVTSYSKLVIVVDGGSSWRGGTAPGIGCSNTDVTISSSTAAVSQNYAWTFISSANGAFGAGTYEIDISDVTGEKTVWASLSTGSGAGSPNIKIRDWYVE